MCHSPLKTGSSLTQRKLRSGAIAPSATEGVAIFNQSQCSLPPAFPDFFPSFLFSTMNEILTLLAEANQLKLEKDTEGSMKNTYLIAFPSTGTIA